MVDQTLEDYALRFTSKDARRWSIYRVAMTALGTTAFLALEALGGAVTLQFGFANAVVAIVVVCAVIFLIGLPVCISAARYGVDVDLLTRGAGFGYLGSTITSLVYASFTFIFFAIEASIMAIALEIVLGIPLWLGYALCSLAVIPIVTHGFTFISRFQIGSQYLWVVLQIAALVAVATRDASAIPAWMTFEGSAGAGSFDVIVFGAAAAILMALVAQLGEQVDYLRFLPEPTPETRGRWYAAVVFAGPGWVFIGCIKLLFGSFVAYLLFTAGSDATAAADPTRMYIHAYGASPPMVALVLAGLMVLISQMKINVTNAYAGSIAWSNFFSRLTHNHPGRVVWLVFNVVIAFLLTELGIYRALESILSIFAIVALAWLGTLAADLAINKPLGLSPRHIEFKRAHLYDINPVGVGSMLLASTVGIVAYLGAAGEEARALAHFITLLVCLVATPAIAKLTRGRYYVARSSESLLDVSQRTQCCMCEHDFEAEDMAYCPFHVGPICSLCCSLDAHCRDECKTEATASDQLRVALGGILKPRFIEAVFSRNARFVGAFALTCILLVGLLALLRADAITRFGASAAVDAVLMSLFFILAIVAGVLIWLFLLADDSRNAALDESRRHTELLMDEMVARERIDRELQAAKDVAEAANDAKTRYLSGISHEFRTPLQAIVGYAQIMRRDPELPRNRARAVDVIHRSGEHLADLVEGLLDFAKIESGRIEVRREAVDLHELLVHLERTFAPTAAAQGIEFDVTYDLSTLPQFVRTDGQRLRQVLTNLLSNAVKFTPEGRVELAVAYRSQVATFTVDDTGIGIPEEHLETIFRPFERVPEARNTSPGTGLGLTIVQLLSAVLGGDIQVHSRVGEGSRFTLSLYLASVDDAVTFTEPDHVAGIEGPSKRVLVVDDDPIQRRLIVDLLTPYGFIVEEADGGESCLAKTGEGFDLFLLDVSMPGMSGLTLASRLRELGHHEPIFMISAEAPEVAGEDAPPFNAYLVKPIRFSELFAHLGRYLDIAWRVKETSPDSESIGPSLVSIDPSVRVRLRRLAEIGFAKGLRDEVESYAADGRLPPRLVADITSAIDGVRFADVIALLEE